jgi:hypothetical protein
MNKEICKKCEKNLQISFNNALDAKLCFYLECVDEKTCKIFLEQQIPPELVETILKESNKFRNPFEFSFFDKMEVNKDCPYFTEHTILTLNRN